MQTSKSRISKLLPCMRLEHTVCNEQLCQPTTYKTPAVKKSSTTHLTKYGGRHRASMLTGMGIGPELMHHVEKVFLWAGIPVDFEKIVIKSKSDLDCAITSVRRNGVALRSTFDVFDIKDNGVAPNVNFRNALDLFMNLIHVNPLPGIPSVKHEGLDLVLFRQNTEGEYSLLEHECGKGTVQSLKIITRSNSERLIRGAFKYASHHELDSITVAHKAEIMKLSDGLFLEVAEEVAKEFPDVELREMSIGTCCAQLLKDPSDLEVLVSTNLYGLILANCACGVGGGSGLYSGGNFSGHYAVFEPAIRNAATNLVGKNVANPIGMFKAAIDMLEHLGEKKHAGLLERAIEKTVGLDKVWTPDMGGSCTTTQMVDSIMRNMGKTDGRTTTVASTLVEDKVQYAVNK